MPDGGGASRVEAGRGVTQTRFGGGIRRDQIDLRDRQYEPTLAQLRSSCGPHPRLARALREPPPGGLLPRFQGDEGTCGGQALAALVDIQRLVSGQDAAGVSARMLYQMGLARLDGEPPRDGVTLRDVIKGFYNYGVCRDADWPYAPRDVDTLLDFNRARAAKGISLGAYYRLRPNLNTYHAALHETGAVLVSAELHKGWATEAVAREGGVIVAPRGHDPKDRLAREMHAFVIVGYTETGFLVLNSWGPDWGGWTPPAQPDEPSPAPVPGVALWRYDDWADRILDGWALRLGVGAAEAFDYSVGDQGLGFGGDAAVRSTPVHAVLGHFLHTDDGDYVPDGRYPSIRHTLEETFAFLRQPPNVDGDVALSPGEAWYRGMALTFGGAILGLSDAAEQIAKWKRLAQSGRWFPMTALWCVDYVEQARSVLDGVFTEAGERAGGSGDALDRIIEDRAHGIGRALWRDIEAAAGAATRPGSGPHRHLVANLVAQAVAQPGFSLRIFTESEGAIALSRLLSALHAASLGAAGEREAFFEMLESVDIVAPPMTMDQFAALARALDDGWGPGRPDRVVRLHLASASDERRLSVPPYGQSYPELVLRSFQARGRDPGGDRRHLTAARATRLAAPRVEVRTIEWPKEGRPKPRSAINQRQLIYDSDVGARLRAALNLAPRQ
jgi:hypothetical protein